MDILKFPSDISLSGNMQKCIISTPYDISFVLKDDTTDEVVIEHSYSPSADHLIEVDLKPIIQPLLAFHLQNVTTVYKQPDIMHSFTVKVAEVVYGVKQDPVSRSFKVIRTGVDELADAPLNFLKSNFLTWQPNVKGVTYYSPEFLTYYASEAVTVKCTAYFPSAPSATSDLALLSANTVWTIPVSYSVVASKFDGQFPSYYDIWIETSTGNRLTYIQRYYADDMKSPDEQWVLFENSLGGIDTFRAYGNSNNTAEHTHNIAEIEEDSQEYRVDTERSYSKNTGHLDKKERLWLLDFFPSLGKYIYLGNHLRRIVVTESDVNYTAKDLPSSYTFTYKYADARPYLNIPRTDTPQDVLNITVPDLGSFTVAPRLVEFPRLTLSDGALLPIQDPNSESWATTSLAALVDFVLNGIQSDYKGDGGVGHSHPNLSVLNVLQLVNGYLTANGEKISAGYADKAGDLADYSALDNKYLRKDRNDIASGIITFLKGVRFANTLLTDIVKSDDWKKIMDDTQLVTGGGMEAYVQYIISQIADKYLRRDIDDEAKGLITFLAGLKSDDLATFLSGIEVAGLAVFKNTLSSETFVSGWSGYGWRLLMKEVMNVIGSTVLKSELEVDELTVRGSLRAFEFIINQLRGENDNFVFAGMQKVQSVDADNKTIYLDTNKGETYCPFTEGDILRCQRFQTGGTIIKQYDIVVKEAHVGSLSDGENRIDSIVWEAFSGDINDIAQGDVLCRLDNDRDPERKGIITTTSVGSNSPYIDVIYGLITNPKESLKVRLGKLDGIVNELLGELSGYGLYSNNAFLTGEFYLSTGEAVSTKIKMLENLFSSSMSKTTYDIKEDDNIVTNCAFVEDMRGWTTVDGDDMDLFFIDDDTPVFMNDDMFSDGHSVASLENVQGKNMLHLLNAGVTQDNALFAGRVPEDSEVEEYVRDSEGNIIKNDDGTLKTKTKTIRPTIYISYRYMCKESGSLSIGFNNGRTTQYSSDMGVIVSVDELGTLTENVNANDGVWVERQYKGYYDKLGDFSISTTGEVYIDVLAVTSKPLDDYKNVVSTQLLQQYNVIGFYGKNIDANKQEYTKLYSVLDAEQKKIVNFVGTENLTNGSTVSSLITQSANSIKQTVAETYATKTQVSTIEQTASNISLVVEQTRTSTCDVVYNNNVTIKTDASDKTMAALSYTITPTFLIANEAQTITSLSVASGSGSGNPRLSISGKSVVVICDQGATLSSPKMLEAVASVTRSERQVDGTTKNVTYTRSMFITVSPAAKGDQGIQGIQGVQGVQGVKGNTGAGEVYALVDNGSYATLTAADSLTFYLAFVISKTVDGTSYNIDSSWYSNHKVQYKSDSAKIRNWTDITLSSNSYAQTILNAIAFDASSYNTTDLFMVRLIETSSGAIMADFTVPLKLSKGAAISITDNRIKIQVLDSDKWAKIDTTANRIEAVVSDLKSKTGIDITNGKIEISSVDSSGKPTGNFIVNTGNFKVKSDGTIECSNGIFSGKITATSGKIGVVNISSTGALVTPYWNITADGKLWCSEARIIGEITATSGTFNNCTINETCKAGFMNYTANKLDGYVINCGLVNYDNLTNAQRENLKLPSVPSGSFLNVRVLSFLQTRVPVAYTLNINDANGVFADNEYFNVYNTTYKSLKIAAGSCYNFLGVNIGNRSVWISLDKALPRI